MYCVWDPEVGNPRNDAWKKYRLHLIVWRQLVAGSPSDLWVVIRVVSNDDLEEPHERDRRSPAYGLPSDVLCDVAPQYTCVIHMVIIGYCVE